MRSTVLSDALLTATTIGTIIQILKLGDLILRPHQRHWLQDKLETLALGLADVHPLNWYGKAINSRGVFLIESAVAVTFFAVALLVYTLPPPLAPITTADRSLAFLLQAEIALLVLSRYGTGLRSWVFSQGTFWTFVRRYFVLMTGGTLALLLGLGIVWTYLMLIQTRVHSHEARTLLAIPALLMMCPILGAVSLWWIAIVTGHVIVAVRFGTLFAAFLIRIVTGIAWRIVEFDKGAWAALTLIATVLSGILGIYIRCAI